MVNNGIKNQNQQRPYRYLLGKIVAEYGQQKAFAAALGITKEELSNKMTGRTSWTKKNIRKACELLKISREDVGLYFFPEIPTAAELKQREGTAHED